MPTETKRSEGTRTALRRAGAKLFSLQGFEGASVAAIASEAGVNKALVSYHFGGKQGLYSAILLEAIRAVHADLVRLQESSARPEEKLRRYIDALFSLFDRYPHFPFMVLRDEMSGGLHLEPDVFREFSAFFRVDREILEEGMREGVFREVDPHAAHLSLVGSVLFFLVTLPLRDRSGDFFEWPAENPAVSAYAEHVKEFVLRGLSNS